MNQAWGALLSPGRAGASAVPVLPATVKPGTAAAGPVPRRTTSIIIWVTAAAGLGKVEGPVLGDAEGLHAVDELLAEVEADLAEGGVARLPEAVGHRAATGAVAEVVELLVGLGQGQEPQHRVAGLGRGRAG